MKKNKKKNPIATLFVAIGNIALLGAVGWYVRNLIEDIHAEKVSADIAEQIISVIEQNKQVETDEEGSNSSSSQNGKTSEATINPALYEMPTAEVEGCAYIGIIEIPSASLSLPVAYDWDYDKLAYTPCRYSGSYHTDDLVICAHDYGAHFRAIRSLNIGSTVSFTAVGGEKIRYVVTNVETVQPTEVEHMINNSANSDSNNEWDLTLFTCNVGGQTRCAVRCEREK